MSDVSMAPLNESEADTAIPDFSDNPVCSGDGKTCGECGKVFSHPFYFSTHISIHASEKGYSMAGQCVHCGLTFSDPAIFQEHLVSSQAKLKVENETEDEEMATTACLEYDNAEQDNERQKDTEARMSRKLPAVKPDLSRELVTVKQEILDPPDVSHEPKAKRRRTAIQRYEPETHADPDNDPAVEAYLMSLTQMGLTVDPAAFGHPSGRSRGKRGAQGRGRSRGHRQPFGRGATLVLPRNMDVPKKPSPKYEYLDYDNVLEDEGEILPKSGKQTRGERLQQRLQRLSQQKEPENQPAAAVSDSVSETKVSTETKVSSETKDEPKKLSPSSTPKPKSKAEKVSKPGSSGLSPFTTPGLDRSFALDKNMIKAEMEDRDYSPHSRHQGKGKRGSRGFRGHQRGTSLPALRPPPAPPQPPPPAPSIPGLTGYARANPNFRPPVVQTAARPPPSTKAGKHGAIASQLKIKSPNAPMPTKSARMPSERSTERGSKTTRVGPAKEAFPKFLKVTSPKGIERSKQESRDYVEIMLQTLSDELIPNKLSKTFPTSTTFFGNSVDILTGTSVRMPHGRSAFPGTTRPARMSAPVRGSMFTDPFKGQVRHAGKAGFPDHSKGVNFNFNNGSRFPGSAPVRAPRSRGRAGASVGAARGRGQMTPVVNRSGVLAQSLAYPVKIGRGVGRGEKNASRPPVQKPAQKPLICTDEVIVLEDDDEDGDSLTNKVKSGTGQKSTHPEKLTTVIVDIDKADHLKSKTEVIQVLAEKTPDSPDLTSEQDKKLNLPASVCLERIDTSSPGSKADPEGDKAELKDKEARSSKKEGEEMEVEDLDGWKVCLAANSDSESETEECPDGKKDLNAEVVKEGNLKPISESPRPDQEEKSVRVSDKEEKEEESSEDGKASDKKDASENSISSPVPSSSSAVPLTFPPFIKDTDNLLDIFSEIEKTCKEIEENSGNEKEDSGTESEGKESPSDTKARTVAADPPQEVSKMDEGAMEEAASDDCKVGNALRLLGGDHDKSSEDSDEINSSRHDSSPDKVTAPGNKEQQESTEARDLDCDEKNHAGVLESDSCMAGANVKEPNDKSNDETAAGTKSDDVGVGIRDTDVEMNSGESDALIGSPTALKKDAADSNSDVGNASPAEQHIAEECGVDVKRQVVTDFNRRPDAGSENLTTSNQCFPDRKTLSDDSPVGQSGDEAMETDDGNITVAPSADTVGMDSSDPSEAFSEPVMNTESGPGELEAGKRLNSPPSEINKDNENLTDKEEDIDKSLESSIPFPASDKNNALVKFADSKNVSGNGPGVEDSKNSLDFSKTVEASPNVEADKDPDLKAPSFCDIPFEAQQQDDKSIPCETDLESTELNRAPTLDNVRPNVAEDCVAQQDGAAENETGSEETFKKRSPGRTSCRDSELTPGHFDGEDDADRDGSDCHGSGASGSRSSRLNGVACTISGGKDGTTASAGGGNSQSVNVSDCDSLSTYGLSSASVEKNSMKCTETQNGKCSVKTGNWKRWARRTAPVMTKNASAIMSLSICPSQSLKISPSFFKKVFRLQKSSVRNQKSGRKICNCPPRALSKRLSTPQLPKNHSLRSISDLVPGVWCTSGKGHPLNEHTVVYNVGCSGRFSDHQITSFIPGSRYVSKDDLMGKMVHYSNPLHKCRVMFCRQAECCPVWSFPFESVNHDTLQHPVSHCVKENSCVKMYYGNVSKIQCPQHVLPKMQKSCKLMHLKSGALARKLWLNKFISHHTTVHRGSQSGARSRGQHEQHRGRGYRGMSSIESGSTGRNRGNSSNGLAGDRSGSDGDQGDDGNRDERDKRLDIVKEGDFLKCSVCGIRFEFLKEWQKHMLRLHAGNEGSSERQNARLQPGFILPGCKEKPQSFCAERTDSFSKSIESSHFNSNTYENLTIGQTRVVLVKPNKPVVTLSSPGKTKKAAKRPSLDLVESLKRTGRDRKKNDAKTSEVECNFHYEKEWNLDLSRKLRLKKHLTGKITKLTGISKANMFLNQSAVPVGGQEHVMACSNNSVLHPPDKSSVNSLALLAGSGAIKAELPSPDNPAGSSISVRAEPELFGSVAVKTEPCSDHSGSPPIKEEPLSDREDDFLTVTFEDSHLFKIESPEASVSKTPADSSTDRGSDQETAKTNCNDSNTIPKPELDNHESLTDGRRVMGDLDSTSIKLRSHKKPTQKEQETKTEIVFVYPNKPVINASPRSHSQLRCPDVMPGSREPQEDERKEMGNMDSSSVIHSSPKKTTQKDQETKTEIVFVYPDKPVINALPRSHSQLRCLDVMLDSREPQKDEIKGMGNMDSSSVIHNLPKKTAPKDQEIKTEIVFVYPDKPVINALPRSHSDRTRSTARKKSLRPPTTSCSKNDDPQQVLNQGGNGEWSTSALQAEHKCRQTLRIDTTFSLREPGSVPGQKNEPQTLKPTLVYVHPKQPVVNLSGRASRSSPSRAKLGLLRKAKPVKCS